MTIDNVKCPLCQQDLIPSYVDIGNKREPTFILGLTCDCQGWLELEMSKSQEYANKFGEIDE